MDIKGDWKKRAVCGLMVLAMALSLLPTSILAADTRSVTENAIKNGSFEQPAFDDRPSPQWVPDLAFDWKTTAFGKKIEFGSRRNGKDAPQLMGDQTIPDGSQFAELNADEESTLYQYAERSAAMCMSGAFLIAAARAMTIWRSSSARSRTKNLTNRTKPEKTSSCA